MSFSDAKFSYDIYKYTRMSMDPALKHTRFEMPKAALELLAAHAGQFNQYLMDEYEVLVFTILLCSILI